MKKLLGLSLVCALFLAMLSMPTTAEARNYKLSNKRDYQGGIVVYKAACSNGNSYHVQKNPGELWFIVNNLGGNAHCTREANKRRQNTVDDMASVICSCN